MAEREATIDKDRELYVETVLRMERELLAAVAPEARVIETSNTAIPGIRRYRRENETAPWVLEPTNGGER